MRKQYHTRTIGPDTHTWDVHRLIRSAKSLPTETIQLTELAELDELWWFQGIGDRPTPRAIADHLALTNAADLSHPILLCAEGRLMDGMHRVVKALSLGQSTIRAKRFLETPPPDFVNVDPDTLPYPDEKV